MNRAASIFSYANTSRNLHAKIRVIALQVDRGCAGDAEKGEECSRYDPRISRKALQGCPDGGCAGVEEDAHPFTSYWRKVIFSILFHKDRFGVCDTQTAFFDDPCAASTTATARMEFC